jgi:hypothetical protein
MLHSAFRPNQRSRVRVSNDPCPNLALSLPSLPIYFHLDPRKSQVYPPAGACQTFRLKSFRACLCAGCREASTRTHAPQSPRRKHHPPTTHLSLPSSHHLPRSLRHRHSRGKCPHVRDRCWGRGQVLGRQRAWPPGNRELRESEPAGGCDRCARERRVCAVRKVMACHRMMEG